jgi:phosphoribosylformylglycinamidine cyclo-ligase
MYAAGEYDLAGFSVGVVARRKLIDGSNASEGDPVIALPSSGLHSNGYSLARRVFFDEMKLGLSDRPAELGGQTVGEALLTPTRLYARAVRALVEARVGVRAMSHITGAGLPGNLPRVLPEGFGVRFDQTWSRAGVFDLLAKGGVDEIEMRRTFNVGIGFVLVVAPGDVGRALELLRASGELPKIVGRVVCVPLDRPFEERVEWPS